MVRTLPAMSVADRMSESVSPGDYAAVAEQIVITFKRFRKMLRSEGARASDSLAGEQMKALADLRYGPLSMSKIAESVGVTRGGATGLVKKLVARGLVERASMPANRRTVIVRLTPEGDRIQAKAYGLSVDRASRVLRRLTREEFEATRLALAALDRLMREEEPTFP